MTERFTLLSELGRGGMGVVWKARDRETGQIVALKLLRETYAEDSEFLERFERELELAKRIHSDHVVKVLGFGVRKKVPYLALEYVDGPSLHDALVEHGSYSWPEAKDLLRQIAQGLADAHAAGVIHRDLKPSNVLIGPDGVAKLADFGIAKGLDLTRVTATSTMLGTPAYMAPEGPVDIRSDLYSLGIIGFELLTGSPPFPGSTYQQIILAHVRTKPDLDKLPADARPAIEWLLAKDAEDRPQNAGELLSVLAGAAEVRTPAPQPVLAGAASSTPAPAVLAADSSGGAATSIPDTARVSRRPPIWAMIIAVFAFLVFGGTATAGWSGVVQLPIVSPLMGMDRARDLGMRSDQQALASFCTQNGITWASAPENYTLANHHVVTGTVAIDGLIAEGALGALPELRNPNPYVSGINFRIHYGYVEMAAFVKGLPGYPLSGPVYGQFSLERTGDKSVQVHITHFDFGHIGVPGDFLRLAENQLNAMLNQAISDLGITIDALDLREGAIYFKGTWPQTISADAPTAVGGDSSTSTSLATAAMYAR